MHLKPHILLVEDQLMPRMVMQSLLDTLGCEVKIAETGTEAIELAKQHQFNLIFMDIGLPDLDGFAVTQHIRALDLPYGGVPIVALTAHNDKDNQIKAIEVGMQAFFTKPLNIKDAESILQKFCN